MERDEISSDDRYVLQERYIDLTRVLLPAEARINDWSLREDHCFMRVILDHLFSDCWYNHLDRRLTAYKQLTVSQLKSAVGLAEAILREGQPLLKEMNARSLGWRRRFRGQGDPVSACRPSDDEEVDAAKS